MYVSDREREYETFWTEYREHDDVLQDGDMEVKSQLEKRLVDLQASLQERVEAKDKVQKFGSQLNARQFQLHREILTTLQMDSATSSSALWQEVIQFKEVLMNMKSDWDTAKQTKKMLSNEASHQSNESDHFAQVLQAKEAALHLREEAVLVAETEIIKKEKTIEEIRTILEKQSNEWLDRETHYDVIKAEQREMEVWINGQKADVIKEKAVMKEDQAEIEVNKDKLRIKRRQVQIEKAKIVDGYKAMNDAFQVLTQSLNDANLPENERLLHLKASFKDLVPMDGQRDTVAIFSHLCRLVEHARV